jgi:hypothetical protein
MSSLAPLPPDAEEDHGVPMRWARLVETGSLFRHTSKPPPLTAFAQRHSAGGQSQRHPLSKPHQVKSGRKVWLMTRDRNDGDNAGGKRLASGQSS